ncbi:hypothetical protein [Photorhabdus luminescens]|uniref:hypothetical protein n=1 Tax=Photorhabdus luminescens TaxID=29488 RepID=UPI00159629C5|nr:hypothetical protein [Photorhabdus luminescens]
MTILNLKNDSFQVKGETIKIFLSPNDFIRQISNIQKVNSKPKDLEDLSAHFNQ